MSPATRAAVAITKASSDSAEPSAASLRQLQLQRPGLSNLLPSPGPVTPEPAAQALPEPGTAPGRGQPELCPQHCRPFPETSSGPKARLSPKNRFCCGAERVFHGNHPRLPAVSTPAQAEQKTQTKPMFLNGCLLQNTKIQTENIKPCQNCTCCSTYTGHTCPGSLRALQHQGPVTTPVSRQNESHGQHLQGFRCNRTRMRTPSS